MYSAYTSSSKPSQPNSPNPGNGDQNWSEWMKRADEFDERMISVWKDDSEGVLVFTALFSTISTAAIIESYKRLSPDSGDQTTGLLADLSQQVSGSENGTQVPPFPIPPFSPSFFFVGCNIMWLLSLGLSISSAMIATLLKQYARRYMTVSRMSDKPEDRAKVRSFLLFGVRRYYMHVAVEVPPAFLHASVGLFALGLLLFFYPISKAVFYFLVILEGIFFSAYVLLTVVPWFDGTCPFSTPISTVGWYYWHFLMAFVSILLCFVESFKDHWKRFKGGYDRGIVDEALATPMVIDLEKPHKE
ncbi:hypothetical protein B0F90DRAFT_1025281 [Multifurca ochricompacta]|uniref:DUF6535 domain-containing protein n=1 Tax=Multifurca ochricompacta TaxID=376703 RepID=A0AAD4QIH7_9AGAM|nr:hypothetical protein B0F90DRAFT_1025281 [Multifurca ochricompacta]